MKEFILAKDEIKTMLQIMPKEGVVLLQGDLASGKTSLVQAWVKFLVLMQGWILQLFHYAKI